MIKLDTQEKYFVSCFIERCNELLLPAIGKCISLYTLIDETNETRRQQLKQTLLNDPFIADRLRVISDYVEDEKRYKIETQKLKDEGYWSDGCFSENFRAISEWLWLVESDTVRRKVLRAYEKKKNAIESEKLERDKIRNEFFEKQKKIEAQKLEEIRRKNSSPEGREQYRNAMIRLATNSFQKPERQVRTLPSSAMPTGALKCFICEGSGKTLIGRVCSKCTGRGFLIN